jgi:hypothetical protein
MVKNAVTIPKGIHIAIRQSARCQPLRKPTIKPETVIAQLMVIIPDFSPIPL